MLIKQDFTNLLSKEIEQQEAFIAIIEREVNVRESVSSIGNYKESDDIYNSPLLKSIHNQRAILSLQNELKSKKEFLLKLKEKALHDEPFIEEDYLDAVNNFEIAKEKISTLKDLHDQARCNYLVVEIDLWMDKKLDPAHKEAVGHYFKALRLSLIDSGAKL